MPGEIIRRAVLSMDGLRGCPRGDAAIEKRGDALEKILAFRKCLDAEAVDRAVTRIVNEFDDFPTPRQFADIVQSSMGGTTLIADPVYIADGGYTYVVERSYAHYHGHTAHGDLIGAEKEASRQVNKFYYPSGKVEGLLIDDKKPSGGNLRDFVPLEDYA